MSRRARHEFDWPALATALNTRRAELSKAAGRPVPWLQVAAESGVLPNSISRVINGHGCDVSTLARLLLWLGPRWRFDTFVLLPGYARSVQVVHDQPIQF